MEPVIIHYRFRFLDDQQVKDYIIKLDPESITCAPPNTENKEDWTKLDFHQCSDCPLKKEDSEYCPIAVNLSDFVDYFKDEISHKEAIVIVRANNRYYSKKLSLQEGLYSVYGLIMSTSNCPVMNFFKPMARFHLPFASMDETIFRTTSSYLLEQYYLAKKGHDADLKLDGLLARYKKVEKVNEGISSRLRAVTKGDADRNAVALLDTLAQVLFFEMESSLESMEYLFHDLTTKV